jgi:hypothetical protein
MHGPGGEPGQTWSSGPKQKPTTLQSERQSDAPNACVSRGSPKTVTAPRLTTARSTSERTPRRTAPPHPKASICQGMPTCAALWLHRSESTLTTVKMETPKSYSLTRRRALQPGGGSCSCKLQSALTSDKLHSCTPLRLRAPSPLLCTGCLRSRGGGLLIRTELAYPYCAPL